MTGQQQEVTVGTRLGSLILDHFIMTMIVMLFFIPMLLKNLAGVFTATHEQMGMDVGGTLFYVALIGFAVYFCKDIVNGRSIGKRITKTQVIDNKTGQVASPLKCFIRNIFCVIWPIEGIATLINPSRRIGDRVAGTKVVLFDPTKVKQPKFEIGKAILPFTISYGILLLLMLPFQALKSSFQKVNYIESSYNDSESKSLEKMFTDSLGQNLTASVKVYDSIQNQNLKYISVIYTLKDNYLSDEASSEQLRQVTEELLYTKHPKETFTGQAKYFFQSRGSMQSSNNRIGTTIEHDN